MNYFPTKKPINQESKQLNPLFFISERKHLIVEYERDRLNKMDVLCLWFQLWRWDEKKGASIPPVPILKGNHRLSPFPRPLRERASKAKKEVFFCVCLVHQ